MSAESPQAPAAPIIRCDAAHGMAIRAIVADPDAQLIRRRVVELTEEVTGALDDARAEAERLVREAHAEADAVREAAREEARAEAWAEVVDALATSRAEYARLIREAESDILALATEIAARIIRRQVTLDPAVARSVLEGALERVRGKRHVVILVHPEDRRALEPLRHALAETVDGAKLYFEEEPELERGDCILQTESGVIDARISVQLDVLRAALQRGV